MVTDHYLDTAHLLRLGLLSAVVLTAVVLALRLVARRRDWAPERTSSLVWAWSLGAVAAACLAVVAWGPPRIADFGYTSYEPLQSRSGTSTLVWMPCVMVLLWSVLHTLRAGATRTPPVLELPLGLTLPALWLVALPLPVTATSFGWVGALTWIGLAVWLAGQALVATGRSVPGDVAVWTGVALVAADAWPGYVGLVSPVVVAGLTLLARRRSAGPSGQAPRPSLS